MKLSEKMKRDGIKKFWTKVPYLYPIAAILAAIISPIIIVILASITILGGIYDTVIDTWKENKNKVIHLYIVLWQAIIYPWKD